VQPQAPNVFSTRAKEEFLALIGRTRVPSGYNSILVKHAGENRLGGLKNHDHHCLIQQILPAVIRNMLDLGVHEMIMKWGNLFQRICAPVIDPTKTKELETFAAEALCLLELNFPPSFFDTMTNLPIHLPTQLALCGPVSLHWC
jgi:hypothetical protein